MDVALVILALNFAAYGVIAGIVIWGARRVDNERKSAQQAPKQLQAASEREACVSRLEPSPDELARLEAAIAANCGCAISAADPGLRGRCAAHEIINDGLALERLVKMRRGRSRLLTDEWYPGVARRRE